ncbi:hypothetical protein [Micromonospora craterilacus]|uniref:hypothetical protein n=1 Tax=Micromonospora craterilacus TaxID=1655439 RepID=UPI0011B6DBD0|nr:hypothetical protein [Micromonospora craterilacus]
MTEPTELRLGEWTPGDGSRVEDEVPERLELSIGKAGERMLRSSRHPQFAIKVGPEAWSAFIASVQAGQTF